MCQVEELEGQVDIVLEMEWRVLHLDQQTAGRENDTWPEASKPTSSDALPPTRPHHLIMLLPMGPIGAIFVRTTTMSFRIQVKKRAEPSRRARKGHTSKKASVNSTVRAIILNNTQHTVLKRIWS